mmetsp:Transcript_38190/g.121641  ORF Transcript_38190/g.121641 Transcript_38190/m.121641 type:complete len:350 (-) Transcript_38190:571-1620(-)
MASAAGEAQAARAASEADSGAEGRRRSASRQGNPSRSRSRGSRARGALSPSSAPAAARSPEDLMKKNTFENKLWSQLEAIKCPTHKQQKMQQVRTMLLEKQEHLARAVGYTPEDIESLMLLLGTEDEDAFEDLKKRRDEDDLKKRRDAFETKLWSRLEAVTCPKQKQLKLQQICTMFLEKQEHFQKVGFTPEDIQPLVMLLTAAFSSVEDDLKKQRDAFETKLWSQLKAVKCPKHKQHNLQHVQTMLLEKQEHLARVVGLTSEDVQSLVMQLDAEFSSVEDAVQKKRDAFEKKLRCQLQAIENLSSRQQKWQQMRTMLLEKQNHLLGAGGLTPAANKTLIDRLDRDFAA